MIFTFSGEDTSNDSGRWAVIIQADSDANAWNYLRQHLEEKGQLDYFKRGIKKKVVETHSILYSTVEQNHG